MSTNVSMSEVDGLYVVRSPAKAPGLAATTVTFADREKAHAHAIAEARAHAIAEARAHEAAGMMDVNLVQGSNGSTSSHTGVWVMSVLSAGLLSLAGWLGYKKYVEGKAKLVLDKPLFEPSSTAVPDVTATYKDKNGLSWMVKGEWSGTGSNGPLYDWSVRYKGGEANTVYPASSRDWKSVTTGKSLNAGLAACQKSIESSVVAYEKSSAGDLFG